MAARSNSSPVWAYMTKRKNGQFVFCRLCRSEFKYQHSTSNLITHVKNRHPAEFKLLFKPVPPTPAASSSSSSASLLSILTQRYMTSVLTPATCQPVVPAIRQPVVPAICQPAVPAIYQPAVPAICQPAVPAICQPAVPAICQPAVPVICQPAVPAICQPAFSAVVKMMKYKEDNIKKKLLDRDVLLMIVDNLQSFSIVESKSFIKLIHNLDPRYEVPSSKHLSTSLLPQFYNETKVRILQELHNVKDVAITTEIWASPSTETYLTVTCHFVTSEWDLKAYVLETKRLAVEYTAENIADELSSIMVEWSIRDKVCAIVTDRVANIFAVVKKLGLVHIYCFVNILNQVVTKAMKAVEEVTKVQQKVQDIVNHFHTVRKSADRLEEVQKMHGRDVKKLVPDISSRFKSTFDMLHGYNEEVEMINIALYLLNQQHMCLTESENISVKKAIAALEPYVEVTKELSTESFTSLSKVLPMVNALLNFCSNYPDYKTNKLAVELLNQLQICFPNIENAYFVSESSYLDPRFKKFAFSNVDAVQITESRIVRMMQTLDDGDGQDIRNHQRHGQARETNQEAEDAPPKKLWVEFDRKIYDLLSTSSNTVMNQNLDIHRYNEERPIRRNEDPLKWWKEQQTVLPKLQGVARKLLCIPATSLPAERLFSEVGEEFWQRRSNISAANVNRMLFLNKNMNFL